MLKSLQKSETEFIEYEIYSWWIIQSFQFYKIILMPGGWYRYGTHFDINVSSIMLEVKIFGNKSIIEDWGLKIYDSILLVS